MLFRDHTNKQNIFWKYVKHETLDEYLSGIRHITEKGVTILGIVKMTGKEA